VQHSTQQPSSLSTNSIKSLDVAPELRVDSFQSPYTHSPILGRFGAI
jgi:hypothetical protein